MNDFITLAKERCSVRKFKSTPVEQEKLDLILEAGRVAPTACNNQPQKIYAVTSPENREKLASVTPCTFDAPVIFVIGYDEERAARGRRYGEKNFGDTDTSIVTAHMMLEAWEQGIGTCWVGMFRSSDVKKALSLPENVTITHLLPAGYAADGYEPSEMHRTIREKDDTIAYL